ncbi:DUF3159 domain-containing protein [Kribbella solani]|uniref:DUF3159 domain-containing protein n=1 Tax=Kribbella solani TaxID=236067 RepID=UPI0029A8D92A|nr:DUF3159 domain-containing protein [Kribbella solani]MDX2968839.1 DUF3159 domain-containing protein [Kribbella solani]MDX3000548.1 DUF3159 domain-containing protein [Kribbella solani]
MAEPTSRRDQVEDDLQEKLVEILQPEVEAAATQLAAGQPAAEEPAAAEPAKPAPSSDKDFFQALGGWGALLDIGLPWIAFLVAYAATDHKLQQSLLIAVGIAALIAVVRLVRKQPLRNVFGGFIGVLISAFVANRTGNAKDFYVPGLLTNLGYGALYLLTVLFRWPLFGVLYGVITQTGTAWRRDPALLKGFSRATMVFVGLFAIRLIVQVPLYFTGSLNALGIAKIGLGLPFYALAIWCAYTVLRGSMPAEKWSETRDAITHLLRPKK